MSRLRRRLEPLRTIRTAAEATLFVRLSAFAAVVPVLMRLPLPRLDALLSRAPRRPSASTVPPARLAALVALSQQVGAPVIRSGCLTRGMTVWFFLRRRGLPVELCFGLARAGPDGHCWVSLGGEPFLETVDPRGRFHEHYRFGAAPVGA